MMINFSRLADGWFKLTLSIVLSLALTGCAPKSAKEAGQKMKLAENAENPSIAYKYVLEAEVNINQCLEDLVSLVDICQVDRFEKSKLNYLKKAIAYGDGTALRDIYSDTSKSLQELRFQFRDKLLKNAETSNNADILFAAAMAYGDSEIGIINTNKQIDLLTKAWRAGDSQSASHLSEIYSKTDDEQAYLWGLRCNMNYSLDVDLSVLSRNLTAEQINTLQIKAVNKDLKNENT